MTLEREMQLERSAASARSLLFVYDTLPIDLTIALKRLGDLHVYPRASYQVLPDNKMRFDEAYTDGDQKIIFLSDNTLRELQQGSTRKRFTLAHELGHIDLNHRGVRSRAISGHDFRRQANVTGVNQEETDADFWAAAFLMPLDCVVSSKAPEELANRTLTSVSAAMIRLEGVSRRTRLANRQLRPIPERTQEAMSALNKWVDDNQKSLAPAVPLKFKKGVREETAKLQGFLSTPCGICGNYELVEEGGCITCQKCGDSNCC